MKCSQREKKLYIYIIIMYIYIYITYINKKDLQESNFPKRKISLEDLASFQYLLKSYINHNSVILVKDKQTDSWNKTEKPTHI